MCDFSRNLVRIFLFCLLTVDGFIAEAQSSVAFIENKNQWADDVDYISRIPGGKMVIGPAYFRYFFLDYDKLQQLHEQSHLQQAETNEGDDHVDGHAVFVNFAGANTGAVPQGFGKSSAYYNYYIGNDPSHWSSEAHAYEGMLYESVYPNVDLKVYAAGENVKYDWVVAPNGDPSAIHVSYEGADKISLANGNLMIQTPLADIIERKPYAYQMIGGKKIAVECDFHLEGQLVSFVFPDGFDSCYELVVDPLLIFSTYSGSTADNWGSTATPGEHGNLYSSGVTEESNGGKFPATAGAFQTTWGGLYDIGILKYDSIGSKLLFATYLGGNNSESPHSLVMNSHDELIVMGTTSSLNFPTTLDAYSRVFDGGLAASHVVSYSEGSDIIISRFTSNGSVLRACKSRSSPGALSQKAGPTGPAFFLLRVWKHRRIRRNESPGLRSRRLQCRLRKTGKSRNDGPTAYSSSTRP